MEKQPRDTLTIIVNIVVLSMMGFVLLAPNGVLGSKLRSQLMRRRQAVAIRAEWRQLVSGPTVLPTQDTTQVLVLFSDYQCPGCKAAYDKLSILADKAPFRVVHHHFPLTAIHPWAERAARAAICANDQGQFASMSDVLYSNERWSPEPDWRELASRAGVQDLDEFDACLSSRQTEDRLGAELELGRRISVRATPTFVGRRGVIVGMPSLERLEALAR